MAWLDGKGRLNVRSSTQTPFLTRRALCTLFDLDPAAVRVYCDRVGGGFGGKQEMLVEDIVALATLRTGRPVKLEFTREEQFIGATTRHPMKIRVKAGVRRDGTLTALAMHIVSNTGAYGNHGAGVLHHACGESIGVYRCPNKKVDGYAVYTNTVPSGAFRGYGLSQANFAIESAMDELARGIGMDPFALRRRNIVRPGDPMVSTGEAEHDVEYGSYGLEACLAHVEEALADGGGAAPPGPHWLVGNGMALGMIDTVPPNGHHADVRVTLRDDGAYELVVGTAEFGNGTTTVHAQIAATALGTTAARVRIRQSDTEHGGHDTGAFGSTGTVVAGLATLRACERLREAITAFAADQAGGAADTWTLQADAVVGTRPAHRPCRAGKRREGRPPRAHRDRQPRRHAALGRVQRPGVPGRGQSADRRDQHPAQRACGGRRLRHQSDAVPRPDRRRRRPGARRDAVRGGRDPAGRTGREPVVPRLSHSGLRRRAAHRGHARRDLGPARARSVRNR